MGQHGRGGGLAEKVSCPADQVYKLPDHVGLDVGALCEPLAVCEHAIRQVQPEVRPHQTALILGCGAIGLGIVQLLRARGLSRIIVSEISEIRREAALKFGASHAVNPKEGDVAEEVRRLTGGAGPHLVFECAGVPASMETAINVVRIHGFIVEVALATKRFPIDSNSLVYKEVTYKGSLSQTPEDWKTVIKRLDDRSLQPQGMITRVVPLEKVVEDGIMGLARGDEGMVKILVEVNPPSTREELK
jgi:threonine dehydrogenase-like Zn-dependent dehydrogenase